MRTRMMLLTISVMAVAPVAFAQEECKANADDVYFVDSGKTVDTVRPGSNGGNGYQLNILGAGANHFEVLKESYMTTLYVIPGYTNDTAAKWQVHFAAKMGREIPTVRMKNKCTDKTSAYKLSASVRLADE